MAGGESGGGPAAAPVNPVVSSPAINLESLITINPAKRSGQPCIRDLRITVQDVLEYLATGMTTSEVLEDFPDLTEDDVRAYLPFAANRERRLRAVPAV